VFIDLGGNMGVNDGKGDEFENPDDAAAAEAGGIGVAVIWP
jgi:hypothetical protein